MADELQYYGNPDSDSGLTITAKVYDSAGAQVGADVSCSEVGSLAIYIGDMPAASAGVYTVRFFSSGTFVAHGVLEWDGTNEITSAMIDTVVDSIKAKTDTLVNTDLTGIALTTDVTALNNLSSADITAAVPTASSIYTEFTSGSNEDVFKADISSLSTLTAAQVNAQVDAALAEYDAPTKAELDSSEAAIIAAMPAPDEMTAAELHTALDSYANKDDFKADVSGVSTFDPANDTVARVTLVDTTTANTDMRGTDGAVTSVTGYDDTALIAKVDVIDGIVDALPTLAELEASTALQGFDPSGTLEGSYSYDNALRIMFSVLAGKLSGAGTGTEVFRDASDTKDRITATVDATGNRTAITLDGS